VAGAINQKLGAAAKSVAKAENAALITVTIPPEFRSQTAEFIAQIEAIPVESAASARIVVNERTGTIAMGKDVHIAPVAVMHGALTVQVQTTYEVSQPPALSAGTTEVVPKVTVGVKEEPARNIVLKRGATVEELIRALNAIGSTPRDIIAILQNLKAAGALEADLEII
jgi:flagellar P-ring protein precursor FlgI